MAKALGTIAREITKVNILRLRPRISVVLCGMMIGCVTRICVPVEPQPGARTPQAGDQRGELVKIDYNRTLHHIATGDINGDGLMDLILSAHVESTVTPFLQDAEGRFSAGPLLPDPGFHPNGTLILSDDQGVPYVVLNAETVNALRLYRGGSKDLIEPAGEVAVSAPDESARVDWPAWGQTLAITSKESNKVTFFRNFNPARPDTTQLLEVRSGGLKSHRLSGLISVDLEGQGQASVLVVNGRLGKVFALRPQGDGIQVNELASFERGDLIRDVLPLRFNDDERADLFVLGEGMTNAVLLLNRGDGFDPQLFPVTLSPEQRGVQSGIVTRDQDGTLLLWVGSVGGLTVLSWDPDRLKPPLRQESRRGGGWLRFAQADMNRDQHSDLIIGSSTGGVPPTIVYGPLAPQVDAVLALVRASLPGSGDEAAKALATLAGDVDPLAGTAGVQSKSVEAKGVSKMGAMLQEPPSVEKVRLGVPQLSPASVDRPSTSADPPLTTPPAGTTD